MILDLGEETDALIIKLVLVLWITISSESGFCLYTKPPSCLPIGPIAQGSCGRAEMQIHRTSSRRIGETV